jgi:beta-N-acetylhexosaminidase
MMSDAPLPLAAIFSVEGLTLSQAEKSLFSAAQPFGFILFGRNCATRPQLKKLCDELRACVGWDCPILIDQEGGRVARLKSPEWDVHPPARFYGEMMETNPESGRQRLERDMRDMAKMLRACGIDVNCAPVVDVLTDVTHTAIGDRSFASNPLIVGDAADAVCESFLMEGVTPVIKHLPGHGRAVVDSHHDLPVVTTTRAELMMTDFAPIRRLAHEPYAKSIWGMMAHIIYSDIDPALPATLSPTIIHEVIRGDLGFSGLLLTDDLDMKALNKYGTIPERARDSLQAGCDLALYCWADIKIMEQLAATLPPLSAAGWQRWHDGMNASWAA